MTDKGSVRRKKPSARATRDKERVATSIKFIEGIIDSAIDYYALAFRVHTHDHAKKLVLDSFAKITGALVK